MGLSFLSSGGFWTASATVVAVVAVILSQIPPIQVLFAQVEVNLQVGDLYIAHYLGIPNIMFSVDIFNSGKRPVSIAAIDIIIEPVDEAGTTDPRPLSFPIQRYRIISAQLPGQWPAEVSFGTITLKPGENWTQTLSCYERLSTGTDEEIQQLRTAIGRDLTSKLQQTRQNPNSWVKANDELVNQAIEYATTHLESLPRGTYRMYVAIKSHRGDLIKVNGFRFVLYDSQVQALHSMIQDYAYGFGIVTAANMSTYFSVGPQLEPLSNQDEVLANYRSISKVAVLRR